TELLGRASHRIDAFVCANDALAGGVIDALSTKGLAGGVLIVGGDGTASAVGRLREGTQHATVFYDPIALAEETVRAAVALARGAIDLSSLPSRSPAVNPPSRLVPALDVPLQFITRENVTDLEQFWAAASPI
ncbi:MAG TPA: substrate-binding domain-containing protein, partial [Chloroflexota bacterium]|nr:substrate-binding domain-containing protein [Chloroflexota bacterium]